MTKQENFISKFTTWVKDQELITGVALVGSQARGTAREDSDVDLVIVVNDLAYLLNNDEWLNHFGKIASMTNEDFGLVQSRRVIYDNGLEVEFGITTPPNG